MALFTSSKTEWIRLLLSNEQYKPGKGATIRYATLGTIIVIICFGGYAWMQTQSDPTLRIAPPVAVGLLLTWMAYRLIHYPRFADFLINTEAEVNKVSWPSYEELKASTGVVVMMVVIMAVFLFTTDSFWKWLLGVLGILKIGGLFGGGGVGM